jgi:hypothetical protein
MTELDRAFEMILEWKARRMLNADYQASIGASSADGAFKVGAIDAMVYDLRSCQLGFIWRSQGLPRQAPQQRVSTAGDADAQ